MANISVYLHLLLLFISGFVITSATYGAGNDNADNYFLENMQLREEFDVIVAWACGTCLDMNSGRISRPPPIDAETPKSTALYMSMAMFVMYNTLKTVSFVRYKGGIPREDRGRICGRLIRNTLKYAVHKATQTSPRKAIYLAEVPQSIRLTFLEELAEDLKTNSDGRYSCSENDDDQWRLFGSGD